MNLKAVGQVTPDRKSITSPLTSFRIGRTCHPEEGLKCVVEDRPCSGSRRRTNAEKAMWKIEHFSRNQKSYRYLASNEMLKQVQHDTKFLT